MSERPIWLSSSPSPSTFDASKTINRCDTLTISPRPKSTGRSSSPRTNTMIEAAAQQLFGSHQLTNKIDSIAEDTNIALRDYMESFPLVPLTIIPRLSLQDLFECEQGLVKLQQTLSPHHEEDIQLGKYVLRQLSLVRTQMGHRRAEARVLALVHGDVSVALSPIVAKPSDPPTISTNALPIFLQPNQPQQSKSTASLPTYSARSTAQLAKAKELAKASIVTPFTISCSSSDNSLRQRRRRQRPKPTLEQQAASQLRLAEKEKEVRRQAAYQRLMARKEIQAAKKQQQKARTKAEIVMSSNGRDRQDRSMSSSGDESDVSNCSDTDAANEQAIMAIRTVLCTAENDMADEDHLDVGVDGESENHLLDDEGNHVTVDGGSENNVENERTNEGDYAKMDGECEHNMPDNLLNVGNHAAVLDRASEYNIADERTNQKDHFEVDEINERADVHDVHSRGGVVVQDNKNIITAGSDKADNVSEDESKRPEVDQELTTKKIEQHERDVVALQLQQFVTIRTQHALDRLYQYATEKETPWRLLVDQRIETPSCQPLCRQSADRVQPDDSTEVSNLNPPRTSPKKKIQQMILPHTVGKVVCDYRSYFHNFYCILTSVYEQRMTTSIMSGSTSREALHPISSTATMVNTGESAIRLQLRLYESWQSIMNDYATVFGSGKPFPDAPESSNAGSLDCSSSSSSPHYRINSHCRKEVSDIVITALERMTSHVDKKWEEHPSGLGLKTTWNLLWTWSKPNVERKTLLTWQKVNHFKHAKALTRKDCLKKNIGKYLNATSTSKLRQAYDIIPATFILPQEYVAFVNAFQEKSKRLENKKNIWIMKPVALSRGRGISLISDLGQVVYGEQVVIQEYISNPLLLDGYKFDLRLYVLVTSFNPLEAFFYEEGFVRMCTRRYEEDDLTNLFIHLTNSSIQKENQDAVAQDNPLNPEKTNKPNPEIEAGGTKMTLAYLWKRLSCMGADVETVKQDILNVILKSLLCGEDHIPYQVNSFDLLGYDILLDSNFRPWLIEINSSPSMARENELDFLIKDALMFDTLRLVNPLRFDRIKLMECIRRRIQEIEIEKKRVLINTKHPKEVEELNIRQMNEDLTEILCGQVPRSYGEMPEYVGNYQRIAPHTTMYNQLVKLKRTCLRQDKK